MRATDEPDNQHWVHTLAYLFAAENGGDITDPVVNNAAQAALTTCGPLLADLRRSARLHSVTHTTLLTHLTTVTQALGSASRPGVLRQAQGCACGSFMGQPPAQQTSAPKPPEHELQEAIRDVSVLAAEGDPVADKWISNALAWSGYHARPGDLLRRQNAGCHDEPTHRRMARRPPGQRRTHSDQNTRNLAGRSS